MKRWNPSTPPESRDDAPPDAAVPPTSADDPSAAIYAELSEILEEELAAPSSGRDKRVMRRWTAALVGWRRRGALAGATQREAFQVRCVAPGEFEVALQLPARRPTHLSLSSHIGKPA